MTATKLELFDTGALGDEIPLSSAVRIGDLVYVSGNIGNVHGRLELVDGGIVAETRQALAHMGAALAAAGSAPDRVVKCNAYIVDMADFDGFNEAYKAFFGAHKPARATVAVKELGLGGRVEIECVAVANPA